MARLLQANGIAPPVVFLGRWSFCRRWSFDGRVLPGWVHSQRILGAPAAALPFNWDQITKGKGLSYVLKRLKDRSARLKRKLSSTVRVPHS
jgi:hypothetical protein